MKYLYMFIATFLAMFAALYADRELEGIIYLGTVFAISFVWALLTSPQARAALTFSVFTKKISLIFLAKRTLIPTILLLAGVYVVTYLAIDLKYIVMGVITISAFLTYEQREKDQIRQANMRDYNLSKLEISN